METSSTTSEAGEGGLMMLRKANTSLPKLSLPTRGSAEAGWKGSNAASPGPITFVSSLFADDPFPEQRSLSHLIPSPSPGTTDGFLQMAADEGLGRTSNHSARLKSMMPTKLPIRRSPCFTIPPGFSPAALLDSPVLFSPAQVQPSPTTGTYQVTTLSHEEVGTHTYGTVKPEQDASPSFVFKPHPQMPSTPVGAGMHLFDLSYQQAPAQAQGQGQSVMKTSETSMALSVPPPYDVHTMSSSQNEMVPAREPDREPLQKSSPPQHIAPAHPLPQLIERPSEDGYNWRKYGQKQVKGSEYPRSYYKCTYPSCHVKKKVERSYEGQITEIVYKGEHNHPKPQSNRRGAINSRDALYAERSDAYGSTADHSSARGQSYGLACSERSQGSSSEDEADDGDASKTDDYGEDEGGHKRRKLENSNESMGNAPLRTVREPRVVVQTTSEVDILDDGYRWRKYGQKVVKGNAYPRSYYKCTNVGCSVRKHVERSSKDSKAVITTYEGKHNHDVPTGRNSHNDSSATSAMRGLGQQGHDTNTVAKPAISLQEQVLGRNNSLGTDAGNGGYRGWVSAEQQSLSQMSPEQFGVAMAMESNQFGRLQGEAFYHQGMGLIPKEEPGFAQSMQPNYQASFYASRAPP